MEKALALRYDETLPAPFVVAKGRGELARRIVDSAAAHGVAVREDAALLERLYPIDLGNVIPEHCYAVVAELLAFVGAVEGRLKGEPP